MESAINTSQNNDSDPLPRGLDFQNTKIAFSSKDNTELKKTAILFKAMNNPSVSKLANFFGYWAVKLRVPFADLIVKNSIFKQFVGGDSLLNCQGTIDHLYEYDVLTVLDYGAEGKVENAEFDEVMNENLRAIDMAASNNSVPVITLKITGLAQNEVLEKLQMKEVLTEDEQDSYNKTIDRIERICEKAEANGVSVFIDAEESWVQQAIDEISLQMMEYYNKHRVTVYNTYQMYLSAKLNELYADHKRAQEKGFLLGAKLVRGAYMDKERKRAIDLGYPSPIQVDKNATDKDYNEALKYCIENYETIGFCNATHNIHSNLLMAKMIETNNLDKTHPHLNFCQLYGMSDNITFNLASAGYTVAKYVPYGPVKEVIPYLIRRAKENTSVTGEMSRELSLIKSELKRRKLE